MVAQKSGWGGATAQRVRAGASAPNSPSAPISPRWPKSRSTSAARSASAACTSVIDAGRVVNPDTLMAQVQGGLIFGFTAALYGDITVKNGRVQQTQFQRLSHDADQRSARRSTSTSSRASEAPGGIGEPGCTAGPPSLVNAIAAATGIRLRRLPIDRDILAGRKIA